MSGASSSGAAWSTLLEPVRPPDDLPRRPDDPRLGEIVEFWNGDAAAPRPGRAALIGFPQDEGVRRNGGRPGAAEAPAAIRSWLYRLTPWDGRTATDLAALSPLDLGNVRIRGPLEQTQHALGHVVGAVLQAGAVPVVLGGGHETAYGHFLGYVNAGLRVGIVNLDAHLDVRPCLDGSLGHSGSPFRQALEHPTAPLAGPHYACLGAQPQSVARSHGEYVRRRGGVLRWVNEVQSLPARVLRREVQRLAADDCQVYVSIDADCVRAADVPGVSAPNPLGMSARRVASCARAAGRSPLVRSLDLVEINPRHDPDGRSARWAAVTVWNFLVGLALRQSR
jgi:formiminoglutamase